MNRQLTAGRKAAEAHEADLAAGIERVLKRHGKQAVAKFKASVEEHGETAAAAWHPPAEDLIDQAALEADLHRVIDKHNERALRDLLGELPTCIPTPPKPAPKPEAVVAGGRLSAEQSREFSALLDLGHEGRRARPGAVAPLPRREAARTRRPARAATDPGSKTSIPVPSPVVGPIKGRRAHPTP